MKITGTRNARDLRSRDLEPVALSLVTEVVYRTYELRSLFFARADRRRLIESQKPVGEAQLTRGTHSRDVLEIVVSEAAVLAARPRR